MTKFSLNSYRKGLRFFLNLAFFFIILTGLVNLSVSIVLNKKFKETERLLARSEGISFHLKFAYFNIFRGVTIKSLEFGKGGNVFFSARRIGIGFDILSLFKHKISIKNIEVRQSRITLYSVTDIKSLVERLMGMNQSIGFFDTIYFKGTDLWFDDVARLDVKGYLSFIKGNFLVSKGKAILKKIQIPQISEVDFFKGSKFYTPLDYVFEAEPQGEDYCISRMELSNPFFKLTGTGRIQNFKTSPHMSLTVNLLNTVLDDFPVLNREHVQSRGVLDFVLKVSGPLDDLRTLLSVNLTNGDFTFFDSISVTRVNGSLVVTKDHLSGQDFSLNINGIPFKGDFAFFQKGYPHLLLLLFSDKASDETGFLLNLSADWIDSELTGDINTRLLYTTKDTVNTLFFNLKGFRLGYDEDLLLHAQNIEAKFLVDPQTKKSEAQILKKELFKKDLTLADLFCVIKRQKDGFVLDQLKASCYGGTLEGAVNFSPGDEQLSIKGEGHLRDVDLNTFFEKSDTKKSILLGRLDGDLRFDSASVDMFKGQLFITDGLIEENPILNAVADFLGVPSLKKINFNDLSMFFTGGRGDYASQIKLQSPEVSGVLDGKVSSYDKMDGYLSVNISSKLLNESKQFRKILTYIRHDEPSVTFPFKIFSYIHSPRVLWLKNEFKEKLQKLLPERNQRFLQREVNKIVEKVKEE